MNPGPAGLQGEEAAAAYLQAAGFTILARRFRCRGGELDLVARDGQVLVFVEVKTRRPGALDDGRGAVDAAKQRRLVRAARVWLARQGQAARCRFDVLIVTSRDGQTQQVSHIPGAFDAG